MDSTEPLEHFTIQCNLSLVSVIQICTTHAYTIVICVIYSKKNISMITKQKFDSEGQISHHIHALIILPALLPQVWPFCQQVLFFQLHPNSTATKRGKYELPIFR